MKRDVTPSTRILPAFALTSCLGFALALAVLDQPASAHGSKMFDSMDTNGDGKVSAEEHAAGAKAKFDKMDANHDGIVTASEMTAAHDMATGEKADATEMSAAEKIKVIDTDGDGKLTAEEHAAGSKMMFDKMDTNHDGYLTRAEMTAGHAKLMSKSSK